MNDIMFSRQQAKHRSKNVVDKRNPACAGGEVHQRERRDRDHAHGGDGEHAAPRDRPADAVQSRAHQIVQCAASDEYA